MKNEQLINFQNAHTASHPPSDVITQICGATIQHGYLNQRIYLMSINEADAESLIVGLDRLAVERRYTKIFAKIDETRLHSFLSNGYIREATVPGYFRGERDAAFLGKYFSPRRSKEPERASILEMVCSSMVPSKETTIVSTGPNDIHIRQCVEADVDSMASLYREVFQSYPFPIYDSDYLLSTMQTNVQYYCAEETGEIIALASAEKDIKNNAVEMTDFATHPKYRGKRVAGRLLAHMESEMRCEKMDVLYTIARARSRPINRLFGCAGYSFGGILVNNTHIGGQIESMTVWHKPLR